MEEETVQESELEDRWMGLRGGVCVCVWGPPSKSFQFVMFISVHAKKVMVTEGNTTTPGIHGPQHKGDSE